MIEAESLQYNNVILEKRLTKLETQYSHTFDDVKEIKRNVRWIIGVLIGSHTTILGALAKGFNLL